MEAKAGDKLTAKAGATMRRKWPHMATMLSAENETVRPKTDAKEGQWACVSCGEFFANNMQAHGHPKSYRLAWWTNGHFEEP